ncbi:MAG: hypothetical protein AYK18_14965 [Theionarchaea archaeon DG-70]|nr:MAG: hypothetical protein AYK18_14965 [Theionarchaea archaeon DG-70]
MSKESKRPKLLYTILFITVINFILLIYLINPFDVQISTTDWEGLKEAFKCLVSIFLAICPYMIVDSFWGLLKLEKISTIMAFILIPVFIYLIDCIGIFFGSRELIGVISIIEEHHLFSVPRFEDYKELMRYIFKLDLICILIGIGIPFLFFVITYFLIGKNEETNEAPASVNGGGNSEKE